MNTLTQEHPTGTVTAVVAAVLGVAAALGLTISAELSAAIIGLTAAVMSALTPRNI